MRVSTLKLRRRAHWKNKVVPKVRVALRSSINLLAPTPSSTDLPRIKIHEIPVTDEDSESEIRYELEEILPPLSGEKHAVWNTSDIQVFSKRSKLLLPPLQLAECLLPVTPPELHELPSPFNTLSKYPGYPNQLKFPPGFVEYLKEEIEKSRSALISSYSSSISYQQDEQQHQERPSGSMKKRLFKDCNLPVPSQHSSGIFRKFIYSKLSPEETEKFFETQRLEMAGKILEAKDKFDNYKAQAVLKGNRYYKEWERREALKEQEIWDQYKWDMAMQDYFIKLKKFDQGLIKIRPKPIILVNESVTALLRRDCDTPPDKLQLSYYNDDDPGTPPQQADDLPPFIHQEVKDFTWKKRNATGPTMVPGGYLYVYYDVRENGEVYRVEEYEYSQTCESCPSSIINFLNSPQRVKCVISPPTFNTPPAMDLPPPSPALNQSLLHRGWSSGTINAYFLEKGALDGVISYLKDGKQQVYFTDIEHWGKNEEYRVKNLIKAEGRSVNPFDEYYQRVDWFMYTHSQLRQKRCSILKEKGLEPTADNIRTVDCKFKDILDDLNPQKIIEPTPSEFHIGLSRRVKIAICQMHSTEEKEWNLEVASKLLKILKTKEVKMAFFPMAFDYLSETLEETIKNSEPLDGYLINKYKQLAQQYDIWISLGGFHERLEELKENGDPWISHTHLIIYPEGEVVSIYRQMHLFDLNIPDMKFYSRESSYVKRGDVNVVTPLTPIGKLGLGICNDLRFPDFAMTLRNSGADVLLYPSLMSMHTGEAHWEALLKARAIETQCFVIAAGQSGEYNQNQFSYGHSMIIDPWGTVLAKTTHGAGILTAEIDLDHLERMRREMPISLCKDIPHFSSQDLNFSIPSCDLDEMDFPFGSKIRVKYKTVFLESLNSRAFVNRRCLVPGHVLVSCKRLIKRLCDLSPVELSDLFGLVQKVQIIMESAMGTLSSTISVQDGKDAGQTVEHVHVHVLPRKPEDFSEKDGVFKGLQTFDTTVENNIKWRDEDDMVNECQALRTHIREQFKQLFTS